RPSFAKPLWPPLRRAPHLPWQSAPALPARLSANRFQPAPYKEASPATPENSALPPGLLSSQNTSLPRTPPETGSPPAHPADTPDPTIPRIRPPDSARP